MHFIEQNVETYKKCKINCWWIVSALRVACRDQMWVNKLLILHKTIAAKKTTKSRKYRNEIHFSNVATVCKCKCYGSSEIQSISHKSPVLPFEMQSWKVKAKHLPLSGTFTELSYPKYLSQGNALSGHFSAFSSLHKPIKRQGQSLHARWNWNEWVEEYLY